MKYNGNEDNNRNSTTIYGYSTIDGIPDWAWVVERIQGDFQNGIS